MDWLEEKIEQLKRYVQNISLMKSLVCYLCVSAAGAGTLYLLTSNLCRGWITVMAARYEQVEFEYTLHFIKVYGVEKTETIWLPLVCSIYNFSPYIYIVISLAAAGKLFLEKKIRPAAASVQEALTYMSMGDYGHEINYHSEDEMGRVCQSVERVRKKLLADKKHQWQLQSQQRTINAAFAHDIRTPLTVIKGYTEFLQKYVPRGKVTQEMLMEKLDTMKYHQDRLLLFSNTMTTIQNIEKWELSAEWYAVQSVAEKLEGVLKGLCQNRGLQVEFSNEMEAGQVFLDISLLQQVFENLLSNALRYAADKITVSVISRERELTIYVRDDGKGFSDRALRNAAEVYFSEAEGAAEHFGIGLSICKMLCQSHSGSLKLLNGIEGGAIAAATIIIGIQ